MKQTVYIDLDGVIVDIEKYIKETYKPEYIKEHGIGTLIDNHVDIFNHSKPMPGAIAAFRQLAQKYEVYILSTAPWDNPASWTAKRLWVEKHLGSEAYKRLILSHNKGLLRGSYLIDDRIANGVAEFEGTHIHFGSTDTPDWETVMQLFEVIEE